MLRHKVFAEGVAKQIKEYLPPEYTDVECKVIEQKGNNGQLSVGVTFIQPGKNSAPIINIELFYEAVRNGVPLENIMQELAGIAEQSMNSGLSITPSQLNEYNKAEEYLGVRLVNTKANRKELNDLPHIELEGLSLIPIIRFPLPDKSGYGSIKITEEMRRMWGVSTEQIFERAWENEELPRLQGLGKFISHVGSSKELFEIENTSTQNSNESMYLLTNQRGIDGAALIAFPGVLEKLDELFPKGFYVVPSSIHETIIMPKAICEMETSPRQIGEVVRDINQKHMDRKEILSDRIYEYDKKSKKVRQVPESIEKERGGIEL